MASSNVPFMWRVTDAAKQDHILRCVKEAFGVPETVKHVPVDNPVSLDRDNLETLRLGDYVASLKADGVRYVLVLTTYYQMHIAAMVNRAGEVYTVEVIAQDRYFQMGSVYDGELCECTSDSRVYDYLIFNALVDCGVKLCKESYTARLEQIHTAFASGPVLLEDRFKLQTKIWSAAAHVNFMSKQYCDAKNFRSMTRVNIPRHKTDGAVFTLKNGIVVPNRDPTMFKWKGSNPIDILYEKDENDNIYLWIDNDGELVTLDSVIDMDTTIIPSPKMDSILRGHWVHSQLFGTSSVFKKVVEFGLKITDRLELSFMRLRPDKDGPNNVNTVKSTLKTINDGITLSDIYDCVSQ